MKLGGEPERFPEGPGGENSDPVAWRLFQQSLTSPSETYRTWHQFAGPVQACRFAGAALVLLRRIEDGIAAIP